MTRDKLCLCLHYLHAAETVLVDACEWTGAAYLALVIDRLRAAHGLAERPIDLAEFARALEKGAP